MKVSGLYLATLGSAMAGPMSAIFAAGMYISRSSAPASKSNLFLLNKFGWQMQSLGLSATSRPDEVTIFAFPDIRYSRWNDVGWLFQPCASTSLFALTR